MLLQSAEHARDFCKLDPQTGNQVFFSKEGAEREELEANIVGRFASVGELVVGFYREAGFLKLRFGNDEYGIDDKTTSRLHRSFRYRLLRQTPGRSVQRMLANILQPHNTFELVRDGKRVRIFSYRPPIPFLSSYDSTFVVDGEEDVDFMLFVDNVLNDPRRRNEIWGGK